jgi:hypothetical protein
MTKRQRPRPERTGGAAPYRNGTSDPSTPPSADQVQIEPAALADILRDLARLPVLLARLSAALDRQAAAGLVEPLLSRRDLQHILRVSSALLDRLRAGGKIPPPDLVLSRSPRWKAATIRAYLERGGRS